jgi:hypothetical protein
LEWLVSTRGRRVAITPREERSGRHRSRADECPSYGRKLGTSQTTLAFSATAPRQTEARPSHDARRNAMGFGQRRLVEGSAEERVRAVANGLRSLQQMVPRRALAEHDGGTRLMSERESVAVRLTPRSVYRRSGPRLCARSRAGAKDKGEGARLVSEESSPGSLISRASAMKCQRGAECPTGHRA